jgi:hypothetical protein
MDNTKYSLTRGPGLSLSVEDMDKLIMNADGSCALLYLYIIRNGGAFTAPEAARKLKMTEWELTQAANRLRALGLVSSGEPDKKLLPPEELPEYSASDISRRTSEDSGFKAVLAETQRTMGRILTGPELKTLLGIYDYLGLPAEVILMLTNHCVEDYQDKYGPGRLPTIRRLEKEAYAWANMEILTLEQAEKYIQKQNDKKDSLNQTKKMLQINGRALTQTEQKYIESWLDMGFGPDALEIAYDKTVVKTGRLQWKYMDSIVNSWHGKNLHTPEEIAAGDNRATAPRGRYQAGKNGSAAAPSKEELERMERILSKMSNG